MKETVDTLGNQKKMNYALRSDMTKEEFVAEVTEGLQAPPAYFPMNVKMNKEGYQDIDQVLSTGMKALSVKEFELLVEEGAMMLDVRSAYDFAAAHIPNSIFIGLDGSFAPWVGELVVDGQQPIILIAPEGREQEAITRLSRVGFDNTLGFLNGAIAAWSEAGKETASVERVTATNLESDYEEFKQRIFDVRKESEFASEHVVGAENSPLRSINNHLSLSLIHI